LILDECLTRSIVLEYLWCLLLDLVNFFKGVSLDFKLFLASFPVKKSRLCSMGHMLASKRRLFIGVERNAPRPTPIAELREVLILFNCDLGICP